MLVEVGKVDVVVKNPDLPMDFDEFSISSDPAAMNGLRIDDGLFDGVKEMGLDNKCDVGLELTKIVRIGAFAFSNYKLQPRFAADVVLPVGSVCNPF